MSHSSFSNSPASNDSRVGSGYSKRSVGNRKFRAPRGADDDKDTVSSDLPLNFDFGGEQINVEANEATAEAPGNIQSSEEQDKDQDPFKEYDKYLNDLTSTQQKSGDQVRENVPKRPRQQDERTQSRPMADAQKVEPSEIVDLTVLQQESPKRLIEIAKELGINNTSGMSVQEMRCAVIKSKRGAKIVGGGMVEVINNSFAFLRCPHNNYVPGADDIYVSPLQKRRSGMKRGDHVFGEIKPPANGGERGGERYCSLVNVTHVNGVSVDSDEYNRTNVHFDNLTPWYPDQKLELEINSVDTSIGLSQRVIDLTAPLGKGQRALIVAPPRTGKTVLMQQVAHSITTNHPDVHLMVLLIDERPEEVTDMMRSVKGEVVSSTFDEPASRHVQLAEMVVERAKRMVEMGKDVVILLDSITRLARAYNTVVPASGKVLTGGVDSNALQRPKRFFGAARNIEDAGSLTILATALIDTGSRMDEVIFEEFKGTGNCEIILERKLADKRIFPAIDVTKSGTRKEELLVDKDVLTKMWVLRRILNPMGVIESMEFLIDKLKSTKNNADFFESMNSASDKKVNTY